MLGLSVRHAGTKKEDFFNHEKQNQNGQKTVGACFVADDDCHGCADDGERFGNGNHLSFGNGQVRYSILDTELV